jgi:antitoxin VapB
MDRAKLFWSGRAQPVRIPKDFRIDADEVWIRRRGDALILEPVPRDWAWLDALAGAMSEDFLSEGREQPPERPERDGAF